MVFAPKPKNDFAEFIATYFERCRALAPEIEGSAGKWIFEDLIPGLSDFDTRFLVREGMEARDWCRMAMAVAQVHFELARERKTWARNLEHLPGVNLTWGEMLDPEGYYPEFSQWTFYHGPEERLDAVSRRLDKRPWDALDHEYHWKKIAIYYGPYNRTIDPPINLGVFENKYPLHSRLLHYMAPPIHSAVCLMRRKTTPGKLDAFCRALDLFPRRATMEKLLDLVARHYEAPELLREPGLTELERELDAYLADVVNTLLDSPAAIPCERSPSVVQLKQAVKALASPPSRARIFEGVKFARLMKGRLWFYAQELAWFDSVPLIQNELSRMRANFVEEPLSLFAAMAWGQPASASEVLERMERERILHREQAGVVRGFMALADPKTPTADCRRRALELVEIYEPFLEALEAVVRAVPRNPPAGPQSQFTSSDVPNTSPDRRSSSPSKRTHHE